MSPAIPITMKYERTDALGRYMTPAWAGRELYDAHFAHLAAGSIAIEPTCGDGRMLAAIPPHIEAMGVEIDPELADRARARCPNRKIQTGDLFKTDLPMRIDLAFGNLPFQADFMERALDLLFEHMQDGGICASIVPAYFLQTPGRVLRWSRRWSLYQEMLPRTLFPRLQCPICFSIFTRDPLPTFKSLRLYLEADAVEHLKEEFRREMNEGRGLWEPVVRRALHDLGGKAHLTLIYERVGQRRPSENPWWKEKVRQTLQRHFAACGNGVWQIEKAA